MTEYEVTIAGVVVDPIEAASAQEALDEAIWEAEVDVWSDVADATRCVHITVCSADDEASGRALIHPSAPDCTADEHDWQAPAGVVGGLDQNPGVMGHGGGAYVTEVCAHCGSYRDTDTWCQDDGGEPYTSISYRESDVYSEDWIASQQG